MQLQRRVLSAHRTPPRVESAAIAPPAAAHQRGRLPGLLASRSTEVARAVSEAVAAQLAEYSEIIGGQRSRCLITAMFESLVESAVTGEPYSERELDRFRELGARAERWKLPLADLTMAFNVALAAAHREFWSMAPPEDFVEMAEVTARCAGLAELARDACVDGFVGRPRSADARLAGRLLAERLIAGDWDADPARLHAMAPDVAPGYLVLVLVYESAVSATTNPAADTNANTNASAWTKAEEDLTRRRGVIYVDDPSMSMLTVLFPAENEDDARRAAHCAADVVERIAEFTNGQVYATQAYRPGLTDLPATVDEARRMLPLVKAIPDAQAKPYRTDDLLVELALLQQPAIRHRLAGLISPLDAGTGLRRTLEVLLACNLDRERAAGELCIHRRTLYYRMDRIRKLSGIDPNTAHGIQLLRSALTCARMQEMTPTAQTTPNAEI